MRLKKWKLLLVLLTFALPFLYCAQAYAQAPTITSISPTAGPVGSVVTVVGTSFGATQGSSSVSLNGTNTTATTWSDTAINVVVPSSAASGSFSVTVNNQTANSASFTVTALPQGWSDADVGSVGVPGSASYANGVFTVKGSGTGISGTADEFHSVYQPLSGDGTIVARVVSSSRGQAAVMIRETLNANATEAFSSYQSSYAYFFDRASTGASVASQGSVNHGLPYWMKVVRSGSTLSGYASLDGVNWTQIGTSQTITMAQNVYIGLAVSSQTNSSLATATFDNLSVTSATSSPTIASLSATTGSIGSQVVISGAGFGASQGSSLAMLNGSLVTINAWSDTSITVTIPAGATSGATVVSVAPNMNDSNPVYFAVTTQPLPTSWLDQDVGPVGLTGSATYANGVFTVQGSGTGISGTADEFHSVYQPLSGDGTIVARVVSSSRGQAAVMIRETLNANATEAFSSYQSSYAYFFDRASTGASVASQGSVNHALPYWVKVVRSGSTFSGYASLDGVNWAQIGTSQTITMAQSVYIGLAVSSQTNSSLATATFDSVSVSSSAVAAPVISTVSPAGGAVGSQVVISGSGFGATQGNSLAFLNGAPLTINSWSAASITVTIPAGATSGLMIVSVGPTMNDSNPFLFLVGTQPLPSWMDVDVGSVGVAGTSSYANGTFTVKGSGTGAYGAADGINFVYEPLSGDGSIVARLVSSSGGQAGVMIRETLNANATEAFAFFNTYMNFDCRTTTGGNVSGPGNVGIPGLPYWLKLVRSGNTFTAYISHNGLYWTQLETSQTITMAQNVDIGLAVSSQNNSSLATATFDNVSINSAPNPAPVITNLFGTTGPVGAPVVVSGSGFGASQGSSLVTLNGLPMTVSLWSATSIIPVVPSGATSGPVVVSIAPTMNDSNPIMFAVTSNPLPVPWLDQDIGIDGVTGNATFANGTFTVEGAGGGVAGTADGVHFVYQALSGDGSIVARVVSVQSSEAGVMIRETLNPNAANVSLFKPAAYQYFDFFARPSTGASTSNLTNSGAITLPYWVKLVRAGNTFSAYMSMNGFYWTQLGSTQTITMAQNVFVGLVVSSQNNSTLGTATFDGVSINSAANPAPVITELSATTGSVGSEVVISGSGFGSSAGSSIVTLNSAPVTIDSWTATSVIITIPVGATSGPMVVSVAPSMNDSNPVGFTVTSQGLPIPWLDQDIGSVGLAGSASYSNGTFTAQGAGTGAWSTADGVHFVFQPLSGDGSIVARLASVQGTTIQAGAMIRGTLDANAAEAQIFDTASNSYTYFDYRLSAGGSVSSQGNSAAINLPYWLKLVRNGNVVSAYMSPDGVTWTQLKSSETVSMPQDAYVGLFVSSQSNSSLSTATFDNVSVIVGTTPVVTGLSPALAGIGTSVMVIGSNFGATQGSSTVTFNGVAATSVTSWSSNQIVAAVPAGATTGPMAVTVNSIQSVANPTLTILNPVISSVAPPGAALGGQAIISGSGFGNYLGQILINGVAQDPFLWSDTSVTFAVIPGTTSGPLTVLVQGISSNSVSFTVLGSLSITGISPNSGSVGDTVTITGTGFGATQSDSVVTFDGVPATVTSWNNTSIQATVPSGAATGPVTVKVANITVDGPVFSVTGAAQLTDSLGHQSTYVAAIVGGNWYVSTAQGSGCSSCTVRGNIQYQYDASGNVLSTTDELGNITSDTYDANNNVASVMQPAVGGVNPKTTYTYNSFGEVLTMTDPLGNVTANTYDSHGNLLTVTTPVPKSGTAASVTQFAYNSLGELTQITDPLGRITAITYTPAGLMASITDPKSNVTSYQYDARGNRTVVTDAMSNQTSFAYDMGNRLTGITYPDNSTASFTYDGRGHRITSTDQNSKTTTYAYDDADRLTSVTDPAGNVTQYTYDTENNLLNITDANSHTTSFTYDAFGRVTQTTFPSNYFESYAYDANNNLTSKTDRKSQTIQYVYDALNRLTTKTYPDSTSAEYAYDLVGKIQQVNDPTGTYAFAYDNMGRLIGTTTTYSFLTTPFTNSYSYDADSNRTGFTAPDSSTNTYTYDTLNRLTTLANSWAGSFGFSYDALSRRTQMSRPNGIATNYAYDKLSHLLSVLHQAGTSTIDGEAYTVDPAGNRTAKTDYLAGVTSNYTDDKIYELTQVMQGTNTTESYSYDPAGNRLSSLGVSSYTNNTSNELTSTSNASYTYDSNGNLTSKTDSTGTTNDTWDFENRLAQVTLPGTGGTESYRYDPFGRRIQKVLTQNGTTTTTNYLYDGDNEIETVDQNGVVASRYADTENIDEPLAQSNAGATSFFEQDGLGSVTSLTNAAGTLAQTYTYDGFGKLTASSGSIINPFRYTGREFDVETILYNYRTREYDPNVGRFLTEDRVRFIGGVDFYVYAANNSIRFSDPLGFAPTDGKSCGKDDCTVYKQLHRLDLYYICKAFPHSPKADCVRTCLQNFFGPGNSGVGRYFDPPLFWGVGSDLLNNFTQAYGPVTHLSCFEVCHFGPF